MPERFGLEYTGSDGNAHRPVMIHRAVFGSFERFVGVLTEHYGGFFPIWLAPVQVSILPIADAHFQYAGQLEKRLRSEGFRVNTDLRNEKIGFKIRESENRKIPYMIVIGDKETESGNLSVREHKKGDIGKFELNEFIEKLKLQVREKAGYN